MVLFKRPTAVHKFVRYCADAAFTAGATDSGTSLSFSLSQVDDYTEFGNLFDQYRLTRVELTFSWVPFSGTTAATQYPTMYITADFDGSSTPATITEVQSRGSTKQFNFDTVNRTKMVTIDRPCTLSLASTGTAGMVRRSPWIDVAVATEPHYGIVAWFKNYTTTVSGALSVSRVFHLCMRETR